MNEKETKIQNEIESKRREETAAGMAKGKIKEENELEIELPVQLYKTIDCNRAQNQLTVFPLFFSAFVFHGLFCFVSLSGGFWFSLRV